jgi:hypothetical protein
MEPRESETPGSVPFAAGQGLKVVLNGAAPLAPMDLGDIRTINRE